MKKWLSNIGAMLLSTFMMLLVCEGIVRLVEPQQLAPVKFMYDKEIGLIHVPHLKGVEYRPKNYNIKFTNGEDGFRITHKGELPNFVNKKIMFIGDSFTYGKGVNDQETFAYELQQALIRDSVEIINAGVEGRGTDHALRSYQFYKEKYQPNTVIYFAHYNDLADNIRDEYYNVINDSTLTPKSFEKMTGGTKEKLRKSKMYNWLISNSHFFSLLKSVLVNLLIPDQIVRYEEGIDMDRAKKLTSIYIDKLRKEVEADGRKFLVYYIPSNHDIDARVKGGQTEQEAFFDNYFRDKDIEFYNLSEDFIDSGETNILKHFYLLEGHWNPNGHQLVAEKLKTDSNGFY
ncbi:MAG: SGNH/GDSL hydrolase family protein [Saprospiraceae bacterium]